MKRRDLFKHVLGGISVLFFGLKIKIVRAKPIDKIKLTDVEQFFNNTQYIYVTNFNDYPKNECFVLDKEKPKPRIKESSTLFLHIHSLYGRIEFQTSATRLSNTQDAIKFFSMVKKLSQMSMNNQLDINIKDSLIDYFQRLNILTNNEEINIFTYDDHKFYLKYYEYYHNDVLTVKVTHGWIQTQTPQ